MNIVELWRYPGEVAPRRTARRGRGHRARTARRSVVRHRRRRHRLRAHRATRAAAAVRVRGVARRRGRDHAVPMATVLGDDAALSAGSSARSSCGRPAPPGIYETQLDFEHEDTAEWFQWAGPDRARSTTRRARRCRSSPPRTIGEWDRRRFRINVCFDGARDDGRAASGARCASGTAELDVRSRSTAA